MDAIVAWLQDPQVILPSAFVLVAILPIVLFGLSWRRSDQDVDPTEPPVFRPRVPIVGHILGLLIHQAEYFQMLCKQTSMEIFTLKIFSFRIYVINSQDLLRNIFGNPTSFSFDPISTTASVRIFGMTMRQLELLTAKPGSHPSTEEFPLMKETYETMHSTLQDSTALLEMNTRACRRFSQFLGEIPESGIEVGLLEWITKRITLSTAAALYGVENPVSEDHSSISALFDFESQVSTLYLNVFPSITAPAGDRARKVFSTAFKSYYSRELWKKASAIIRGRHEVLTRGGYTHDDLAMYDIGLMMGATMNSVPGLFWLLTHAYSDPSLLLQIRDEVGSIVTRYTDTHENEIAKLNISDLQKSCPLLTASWDETLRLHNATVASRVVLRDTLLDNTYLVRKNSVIQAVTGPTHLSRQIWGPDANTFKATRLLPSTYLQLPKEEQKARRHALKPFGGGRELCPGRHFATNEILGIAAMLVCGFELTTVNGEKLSGLKMKKQRMGVQVRYPEKELMVRIGRRARWEGVKWAV